MQKYKSQCYYNLHRKCFSVRRRGIVQAHARVVELHNASFNIAKAGQQLVRDTKRKNVHATISGYIRFSRHDVPSGVDHIMLKGWGFARARYNPYKDDTFVDLFTGEPVHKADRVVLIAKPEEAPKIYYCSHW